MSKPPVKHSDLLDAIVTAFSGPVPKRRRRSGLLPGLKASRPLRVLVAEDNVTNQKLITALLRQRGHSVSMVADGALAVSRAKKQRFDIILMDVQMPGMTGLEATAAIREHERTTGRRTPIVALTASAMTGDREACLAAGMDAYVAKPLRPDDLFSPIDALCAPTDGTTAQPPAPAADGVPAVNLTTLLAGFGGNRRLVQEVVDVFLEDAPAMFARLRDAAHASDGAAIAAAAHAIKGSAGLFSQGTAYQSARHVEQLARSGEVAKAEVACSNVEADASQLMAELRHLL